MPAWLASAWGGGIRLYFGNMVALRLAARARFSLPGRLPVVPATIGFCVPEAASLCTYLCRSPVLTLSLRCQVCSSSFPSACAQPSSAFCALAPVTVLTSRDDMLVWRLESAFMSSRYISGSLIAAPTVSPVPADNIAAPIERLPM